MHLKLGRECKKDYLKVGKNLMGLDYRIVMIMCSLEDGYAFQGVLLLAFQSCVNLDTQEHRTGLT